jgi:uncharacterized phage protein gp47/JayE
MALNIPKSASEIVTRSKTAVQRALPASNPFLPNSWLSALITAYSYRIYDFYLQLREALKQTFFDTSTGEFLERQASWFGITRLAATGSSGKIIATGLTGSSIPLFTLYQTSDGIEFQSTATVNITDKNVNVFSINRSGTIATVVTGAKHELASNVPVTIAGANESNFNVVDAEITIVDDVTFTYVVADTGATVATGTITAAFTSATIPVQSLSFGEETNLPLDSVLSLQSPIVGVDDDAQVDADEIAGGTNQETDAALRSRFLERVQNPVANFNVAAIEAQAKEVNGVTRVFVFEITPDVGQVTIYFMRDNDENPIPTAPEVDDVKNKILEITPANTDESDVFVIAPTAVSTDFIFSSITPNTTAMKNAVQATLEQFFSENTSVGVSVQKIAFESAIFQTVDESGQRIESFGLVIPATNIFVAVGEIATLGNVTFP